MTAWVQSIVNHVNAVSDSLTNLETLLRSPSDKDIDCLIDEVPDVFDDLDDDDTVPGLLS